MKIGDVWIATNFQLLLSSQYCTAYYQTIDPKSYKLGAKSTKIIFVGYAKKKKKA